MAPQFVRWWPVAEVPPPTDVTILVWASGYKVRTAALGRTMVGNDVVPLWRTSPNGRGAPFTPTHWSPMPEPPLDIA